MATINLFLLENRKIKAEMDNIPLANDNSYMIIAGEENATDFAILSKPPQLEFAEFTVEMVNSQGYGVEETTIINNTFTLPIGMAVAGYGQILIRAYTTINGEQSVIPFEVLKIKVWKTLSEWEENVAPKGTAGDTRYTTSDVSGDIDYTLARDTDKTFTSDNIRELNIAIPANVFHGFYAGVNFKVSNRPTELNFVNYSDYPLVLMYRTTAVEEYTLHAGKNVLFVVNCDGLNVYCNLLEV